MGVFEHFPYTNYHGLNLDWLLHKVQALDIQNEHQAQQIANLEAWIDGANLEELIDERLQEMLDNGAFNDIVAQALGVLITPQALGYPGTKTADEAFTLMQDFTVNPIAIPEGTYNLTADYRLKNVVLDEGTYPQYVPLYKRDLNMDLMGFSMGPRITMPVMNSYEEAAAYLNGYWYMAVWSYNENHDYLVKMNEDLQTVLTATMTRPAPDSESAHACRNVYTDGTYIYVDFTKNTYKYKADDMTLLQMYTHDQINTEYFNGRFWGINYSGTALLISEMSNSFTVQSTHVVDRKIPLTSNQGMAIHNGLIYLPALPGDYTTIVNIYDWSYNNIYYNDQFEIERIAFKDGVPYAVGHTVGIGGCTIGKYNGGTPTNYFGRYSFDGSVDYINLNSINKYGVYDFTNFPVGNLGSSGQLLIIDDLILARVGNKIMTYTSGHVWKPFATTEPIVISVGTGIGYRIEPNGTAYLFFQDLPVYATPASTEINFDASEVWDFMGWAATTKRSGYVFGTSQGSTPSAYGVLGLRVFIEKTKITLQPFAVSGSPSGAAFYGSIALVD